MSNARLASHPAQQVNRGRSFSFTVDGRPIEAHEGDSIASAMYAAGIRTFSRSFKYHRRRGLMCAAGRCPNCLMTADGVPNVRTCTEPAREGAVVRSQHAWPSLEKDIQGALDWFGALLPVGFYYKTFMRPRWLWPTYERVLRQLAGLGRLDTSQTHVEHGELRHIHADLAIVGGGPAGMNAALEAARLGVDVLLVDDQPMLGGHLRWNLLASKGEQPDFELGRSLAAQVEKQAGIQCLQSATAFGLYQGRLLAVMQGADLIKVRAERIIVAAGGFEHPLVFHNNDLPGVFLSEAVQRLIAIYGVRPGARAVVVANDDRGIRAARELSAAGIEIAAVVDAREGSDSEDLKTVRDAGLSALAGHSVVMAHGNAHVTAVTVGRLDNRGCTVAGSERRLAADLLVLATGWEPNNTLLAQDGCRLHHDPTTGVFFATDLPEWLSAAGEVAGVRDLDAVIQHGALAGLRAAVALGAGGETERAAAAAVVRSPSADVRPILRVPHAETKQFVCLCEDVTVKDINDAVGEGFDDVQTLKRYSTVTMGPCQGKMCHHTSIGICAEVTHKTPGQTGVTTARPPAVPVPLGVLAGPPHEVTRRSPLHDQHAAAGATWMDMGSWKRPLFYTSVEAECAAVHERVGIIDVSTLGRLDVKGRDAAEFLEWIHPNRVANLRPGRIRYRLMLDDAGIIIDDGTIARLGEDHFFVTTGTGTLEGVEQWLEWWLASGDQCVHVTNLTGALGAINVAGPKSRELLTRLTDLDLSSEAVPYLGTTRGSIAGVPALLLRIGFVGELGYELHFPAEYGDYLWKALLEAGRDLGIAPFGVEAQRVLRLEKLHIIPAHDTDALSNPYEADMAWVVKLEKPDFVGRAALADIEHRPHRQRLVGFEMPNGVVPCEGDSIVAHRMPVGRVTSAKWSPLLKKAIGMAWVPAEAAVDGGELQIRSEGSTYTARVALRPFYDPEGTRLKS